MAYFVDDKFTSTFTDKTITTTDNTIKNLPTFYSTTDRYRVTPEKDMNIVVTASNTVLDFSQDYSPYQGYRVSITAHVNCYVLFKNKINETICIALVPAQSITLVGIFTTAPGYYVESGASFDIITDSVISSAPYIDPEDTSQGRYIPNDWRNFLGAGNYSYIYESPNVISTYGLPENYLSVNVIWEKENRATALAQRWQSTSDVPNTSPLYINKLHDDSLPYEWTGWHRDIGEYRPAIGVPTIWMGAKPDWAIDFGNGASTQYLWANYPELNTDQFKSILTTLSTAGWMTAYNSTGFYVPDLRGIVPIGYGTNAKRTDETTAGGNLGTYSRSANLSHSHTIAHTHTRGDQQIYGSFGRGNVSSEGGFNGADGAFGHSGSGSKWMGNGSSSSTNLKIDFYASRYWTGSTSGSSAGSSGASGGSMAKPPTLAVMWIVRFE